MKNLDFIEIGTSDFRTLAHSQLVGICIEPVLVYLDRLPNRKGLTKINPAISDTNGTGLVYYCDPNVIEAQQLPEWLKGCNSINNPHPTVEKMFSHIPGLVKTHEVDFVTIDKIFDGIESVDFLKIDTEGHDCKILEFMFNLENIPDIRKIQFESNSLSLTKDVNKIKRIARRNGYQIFEIEERGNKDTILEKAWTDFYN
jgi:FkbM family methyltransferase